ncbi:group II intron maturase-specific domain-containing protein [Escherichia coli]|nr:group II intron maturase-specific domain-containing protein [Escherichia marmotae]MEC9656829.1 group II intron maturase-specific domain-containing protein [Escherichia coli]MED8847199.1 group II intron maturase-specific domain-containing protein [Escherichia coli]MED9369234.1 group II intron maturase-specific domain-containing protein [Escherichia coli]MED9634508.1 group II intron maturase-specific domain-containing protein [Escherichia marmotae]
MARNTGKRSKPTYNCIHAGKWVTLVRRKNDGFDFLGQNVRKYKGKLLIKPSKHNLKRFLDKIKATIGGNKTAKKETLIKRLLNSLIRGWTNSHQHVVGAETFSFQ